MPHDLMNADATESSTSHHSHVDYQPQCAHEYTQSTEHHHQAPSSLVPLQQYEPSKMHPAPNSINTDSSFSIIADQSSERHPFDQSRSINSETTNKASNRNDRNFRPLPPPQKSSKRDPHKWVIPTPTRQYRGTIDDLTAFRDARNARPRHAGVPDENTPGFLSEAKKHVILIYNAFYNTENIIDKDKENGKPGTAVQWMEDGYWDDDVIWMSSWKIVFDWLDVSAGAVLGGFVNERKRSSIVNRVRRVIVETYDDPADRFKMIHRDLWLSKTMCKNWLDIEIGNLQLKLVAAPETMIKRKDIEAKNNTRRRANQRALKSAVEAQTSQKAKSTEMKSRKHARASAEEEDTASSLDSSPILDMKCKAPGKIKRHRGLDDRTNNVSFDNQPHMTGVNAYPQESTSVYQNSFQLSDNRAQGLTQAPTQYPGAHSQIPTQHQPSYANPYNEPVFSTSSSFGISAVPNSLGLFLDHGHDANPHSQFSNAPMSSFESQQSHQSHTGGCINNSSEIHNANYSLAPTEIPNASYIEHAFDNTLSSQFHYQPPQCQQDPGHDREIFFPNSMRNEVNHETFNPLPPTNQPNLDAGASTNPPPQQGTFLPPIPAECLLPSPGHTYDIPSSPPALTYDEINYILDHFFDEPLTTMDNIEASGAEQVEKQK